MKPFYIHVGLGKTGTSWLQEKVFSRASSIDYFGKNDSTSNYPDWLIKVHYLDDYAYDKEKEGIRALVLSRHQRDARVSLLSSEPFTNPGSIWAQAKRIQEIFPAPRIILVLRHPLTAIESLYKHNVHEGRWFLDIEEYLDWMRPTYSLLKRKPICLPDFFYDEILDFYSALFGADHLCALKYEDFVTDPNAFVARIGSFVGVDFGDVIELAREKVLEGIPLNQVAEKRVENLRGYIAHSFPHIAEIIDPGSQSRSIAVKEIISDDLAERLTAYLKGKCSAYF